MLSVDVSHLLEIKLLAYLGLSQPTRFPTRCPLHGLVPPSQSQPGTPCPQPCTVTQSSSHSMLPLTF